MPNRRKQVSVFRQDRKVVRPMPGSVSLADVDCTERAVVHPLSLYRIEDKRGYLDKSCVETE